MSEIGQRLKKLREDRGLNIKQVATDLDISPSTYRDWELGTKISGEPYIAMADYFRVPLIFLLTGQKESRRDELLSEVKALREAIDRIERNIITFF